MAFIRPRSRVTLHSGGATVRMPYPVEGFLLADPFVALMTFLSSHTIYRSLWWSVGMVALTLVFGSAVALVGCTAGKLANALVLHFGRGDAP